MLDIAQMGLTDADTFGKLLLVELTGTAQQADITADTRQPAFIVHTSPQFSKILVF